MTPRRWHLNDFKFQVSVSQSAPPHQAELIVLVRSLAQLDAAIRNGLRTIYCEFEDPKKYREAVAFFRANVPQPSTLNPQPSSIWVAPPRITKPGEEWILKQVRSCEADGYLVRNYDHLKFCADKAQWSWPLHPAIR